MQPARYLGIALAITIVTLAINMALNLIY